MLPRAGPDVLVDRYLAWLISTRCPSGSLKKARTSQSDSTGGVRNSAPRVRRLSYAERQSTTRKVIAWLTLFGSLGAAKVTCGLSSVGPPPVTRSSQVPTSFSTHDVPPYWRNIVAPT